MRNILTLIYSLTTICLFGQTSMTYTYVDSLTYEQYVHTDYKALQQTGKEALRQGIDFYYLRMRIGVTYYETKKYEDALGHFQKAYEMNPADTVVQEYLYYSLIFTQRIEDAYDLAQTFQPKLQTKIGHKPLSKNLASTFTSIRVTAGALVNANIANHENTDLKKNAVYAENTLRGSTYLASVAFSNRLSNRIRVYNGFSYFNVHSLGVIQTASVRRIKRTYAVRNYQYTTGLTYTTRKNWILGGAIGYFREKSFSFTLNTNTNPFTTVDIPFENNAFTGSVSGYKRIRNWGLGVAATLGSLGKAIQKQVEGTVVWYPLGHTGFYSISSGIWLLNDTNHQGIVCQKIGGKLSKAVWYKWEGSYGNHQNYIASNGFVTYNTADPIHLTTGLSLTFFNKQTSIIPSYLLQQRESSYQRFFSPSQPETIKNKYFNHLFTCTVQWNF